MPPKPSKPNKNKTYRLQVPLPGDIIAKLDQRAAELEIATPGARVTRTEVARRAIYIEVQHVKGRIS